MATLPCPDCKQPISPKASACPHCGYPMGTLGSGMKPNDLIKILQSKERDKARAANQKARKFRTQGIFWAAVILIPMAIISPGWRQDVADLLDRPLPVRYGFDDEGDGVVRQGGRHALSQGRGVDRGARHGRGVQGRRDPAAP